MLIAMAVYDTVDNGRSWMTRATLESLANSVDWDRHRLVIVDNGSCQSTLAIYRDSWFRHMPYGLIRNSGNVGTAAAINLAWRERKPGEHAAKMDNDCVIHQAGWADWMEDVFDRDPEIGICGLKRKDLAQCPWATDWRERTLRMLPHESGQRWLVIEEVRDVMGTCQGFSSALLDKIGYLVQPALYGYDDCLACVRSEVAGFKNVFLCGFEIDHIDPGGDAYCAEKQAMAKRDGPVFKAMKLDYKMGTRPVYFDGGCDESI